MFSSFGISLLFSNLLLAAHDLWAFQREWQSSAWNLWRKCKWRSRVLFAGDPIPSDWVKLFFGPTD